MGVKLRYLQWVVVAICTLFPIVSFVLPKGLGASFYLLLLSSLVCIVFCLGDREKRFFQVLRRYWRLHLAMSGILIATVLNQLAHGRLVSNLLELPFYLASFPLMLWALLQLNNEQMKRAWWGVTGGAIVCAIGVYLESGGGVLRPAFVFNIPLIPFANIMLLLGALSLLSIAFIGSGNRFGNSLRAGAFVAALYGAYLTQARGGWVALPLFASIAWFVFRRIHLRHKLASLLLLTAVLSGAYIAGDIIRERISAGKSDMQQFMNGGNKDTSLGLRLQNWQGGWILFSEHPLFGIGKRQYPDAVKGLAARQVITPAAAVQPHTHSDLLFQMASLGIFGLLAISSLYAVPAYYFAKEIRNSDQQVSAIAGMGLAVTLGFFVFGLSDTMFYWKVSYVFYVILLAMLFASLMQRDNLVKTASYTRGSSTSSV